MNSFSMLDIKIFDSKDNQFALQLFFRAGDTDAVAKLTREPAPVTFDKIKLSMLQNDPHAYGKVLTASLFKDPAARSAFAAGRAKAEVRNDPLRVRLILEGSATVLHGLSWERLYDPEEPRPLFNGERMLFSRYLASHDWREVPHAAKGISKALVVLSSPNDLENYRLAPLDREEELSRAQEGLKDIELNILNKEGEANLERITAELRKEPDVLYLVCHGSFQKGRSYLWLEKPDGSCQRTLGDDLITRLAELARVPRLVVLISCESMSGDIDEDVLAASGPALASAGVPAVLAMQGRISFETMRQFLPVFFDELRRDGFLDRAMAVARGAVRKRPDGSMPVLFTRLESGRLWKEDDKRKLMIDQIVKKALRLPSEQRPAFLTGACAQDLAMRAEVEAVLDEPETEATVPGKPAEKKTEKNLGEGDRIGAYRLEKQLGSGGMGVVYRAKRVDGEMEQDVAIKLIKHDRTAPEFLARFRRERQLLATLRHSNIAQLKDVGTTPDGAPFLIMDYVDGVTVTRWCKDNKLGILPCLEIFRKLVEAVALAHRKGVIHRDIKPANVLVAEDGEPVLLDFGIAHTIAANADTALTQTGQKIMTPAYAAPEQKEGAVATPRFDIYSLGLLLLEMITGIKGHREGRDPVTMLKELIEDEITADGLEDVPVIPRPLFDLLTQAMAQNPRQRYANCELMLADLNHVMANIANPNAGGHLARSSRILDALILVADRDIHAGQKLLSRLNPNELNVELLDSSADQMTLATALRKTDHCFICLGPEGNSLWSITQVGESLAQRVRTAHLRIHPVLLPGSRRPERESGLPFYLRRRTWLDFPESSSQLKNMLSYLGSQYSSSSSVVLTHTCPFRGLEVFREDDAQFFFGRESETQKLYNSLQDYPFLAILGPSGSGKSSLVQAGLLPLLRKDGSLPLIFTPSKSPQEELIFAMLPFFSKEERPPAEQLTRRLQQDHRALHFMSRELRENNGAEQICLVIDQFEEIFTLAKDEEEVKCFLENLLYALEQSNRNLQVILTLRTDFLGKCVVWPEINHYICEHMMQVLPMDEHSLQRAVTEPARLTGLEFEPGLVDAILNNVDGAMNELPLLEHALLELYERRNGNRLTTAAYTEIGGIEGALACRAETEFQKLNDEEKTVLRKMFTLCLVQPGEGAEDTRRRASREELMAVGTKPELVDGILTQWIKARLLTGSRDEERGLDLVDVAHEALIRRWFRIKGWMEEDREVARLLGRLRLRADAWRESDYDDDFLLRGGQIFQMEELLKNEHCHLTELEQRFLKKARENHNLVRRVHRRNRTFLAFSVIFLFALSGLVFLGRQKEAALDINNLKLKQEKEEKERARKEAHLNLAAAYDFTAGTALENNDPERAWIASLSALSQDIPEGESLPESHGRFLDGRMLVLESLLWVSPAAPAISQLATTSDGKTLFLAGTDRNIRLIDTDSGCQNDEFISAQTLFSQLAISPDDKWLVGAAKHKGLFYWDLVDGSQKNVECISEKVTQFAISQDGTRIVAALASGEIVLLELRKTCKVLGKIALNGVNALSFNDSGKTVYAATQSGIMALSHSLRESKLLKVPFTGIPTALTWHPTQGLISGWKRGAVVFHTEKAPIQGNDLSTGKILRFAKNPKNHSLLSLGQSGTILWEESSGTMKPKTLPELGKLQTCVFTDQNTIFGIDNNRVVSFDLARKKRSYSAHGHSDYISAVCFSPDGKQFSSGSVNGEICIWDAQDGKVIKNLFAHSQRVRDLTFTPDGNRLVAAYNDNSIRLWDTITHDLVDEIIDLPNEISNISISFDSKLLAVSSKYGVIIFELKTGKKLRGLPGTPSTRKISFSPKNMHLAIPQGQSGLEIYNALDGVLVKRLKTPENLEEAIYSNDGKYLVGQSQNYFITWNTGEYEEERKSRKNSSWDIALSPDASIMAIAAYDKSVSLSHLTSDGKHTMLGYHQSPAISVAFSPDGKKILTGSKDRTLRMWKLPQNNAHQILKGHGAEVLSSTFNPDGSLLISSSVGRSIKIWRVKDSKILYEISTSHNSFFALLSPDGKSVASAGRDPYIYIYDVESGKETRKLAGHTKEIRGLVYLDNGRKLASASEDGTIKIWNLENDEIERTLEGHNAFVYGLDKSSDESFLASGSWDRTIRLWNPLTGQETAKLEGHTDNVEGIDISPNDRYLASASKDETVIIWDLETREPYHILTGHTSRVAGVVFSKDNKWLATTSADHTARLWNVETGKLYATLQGHQGEVNWKPSFSPDGSLLATASDDKTIHLWQMNRKLDPPEDTAARTYYQKLLNRSLFALGYRLERFKLIHQPRMYLPLKESIPHDRDHLDRPRPAHIPFAEWLLQ